MSDLLSKAQLMKVLVADDEPTMRLFLTEAMLRSGYEVAAVEDGFEALKILSAPLAPSLAIVDWNMPSLDGIELCRRIRKTKDHGVLYILVVTGHGVEKDVVAALDAGADDFLRKPFRMEELIARVRSGIRILTLSHEKFTMMDRIQSQQRLESIGQLAAGIAHEINTPMQYIGDNTRFIRESMNDILALIGIVRDSCEKVRAGEVCGKALVTMENALVHADIDFLSEQIPLAVSQSLEGIERVSKIVRAMKEFAHPGGGEASAVDINHMLETVVTVTRNEWKYVSDLVIEPVDSMLSVRCHAVEMNQALINLIVNAAHAIQEKQQKTCNSEKGCIRISACCLNEQLEIRIADTGCGIPEKLRARVMEPFFTTKEVGRGTGQGLAIARSAVVDKHGGTLDFETEEGKGTTFILRIPIDR